MSVNSDRPALNSRALKTKTPLKNQRLVSKFWRKR
jgi:hypothetical protein